MVNLKAQVFLIIRDPLIEALYRTRLKDAEYCAVWHEPGTSWETALTSFAYDLVVIDLSLAPNAPIEMLRKVKLASPDSDVIVLAPNDDVNVAVTAFREGIAEYFLRPTDPEQLFWGIEKTLQRRRIAQQAVVGSAELLLTHVSHQINTADSDVKMRLLAARAMVKALGAKGALWIAGPITAGTSEVRAQNEYFSTTPERAQAALLEFQSLHPEAMECSFENHLTSHPESWFHHKFAWIPLRTGWMGGFLIFDVSVAVEKPLRGRFEFLIRNLEISLENTKRQIEAKQLTYVDDFTGLFNSRYLDIALTAAIQEATSTAHGFAVLFIDIDHFKKVNDGHGHLVGSGLLLAVAQLLKRCMRDEDQLFRYGGDEFIALLHDISPKTAREVAERLRVKIERHLFQVQGADIKITVSIGVARFPEHGKDKKHIIELADKAMYSVKKQGRNAVYEAVA